MNHSLLIEQYKNDIISSLQTKPVLVLISLCVSGITTEIPTYLGRFKGKIAIVSSSELLSNERDQSEEKRHAGNSVVFTSQSLLLLTLKDPLLKDYGTVIIQDLHKKTVETNIILGIMKKLRKMRPELKLVCEMAIDDGSLTEHIRSFYGPEHVTAISIDTKSMASHADVMYLSRPCADYLQSSVETVLELIKAKNRPEGDIIVTLANHDEVRLVKYKLEDAQYRETMADTLVVAIVDPLMLSPDQASIITEDIEQCRIILATGNDVENNHLLMTQSKINIVIDCGFTGLRGQTRPITTINAELRKYLASYSRIGYTGQVFRLYTQNAAVSLLQTRENTADNENIAMSFLRLKVLGVGNLARSFPFFIPPDPETMARALNVLKWSDAIDQSGNVTELGIRMARLPVDSREMARAIALGLDYGCHDEILKIIAMISAGGMNVFVDPGTPIKRQRAAEAHDKFKVLEGDMMTMLNVLVAYMESRKFQWCKDNFLSSRILTNAKNLYDRLRVNPACTAKKSNESQEKVELIIKCLQDAFQLNLGVIRTDGSLAFVDRSTGDLTPCMTNVHSVYYRVDSSIAEKMKSPWFVFESRKNVLSTSGEDEILIEGLSMAYRGDIIGSTSYWKSS